MNNLKPENTSIVNYKYYNDKVYIEYSLDEEEVFNLFSLNKENINIILNIIKNKLKTKIPKSYFLEGAMLNSLLLFFNNKSPSTIILSTSDITLKPQNWDTSTKLFSIFKRVYYDIIDAILQKYFNLNYLSYYFDEKTSKLYKVHFQNNFIPYIEKLFYYYKLWAFGIKINFDEINIYDLVKLNYVKGKII